MSIPSPQPLRAVVFDFGDTLFTHPDGTQLLVDRGWTADQAEAAIEDAWRESKTSESLTKHRDRDPESHRRGWLELLQGIDDRSPGMAQVLYEKTILTPSWVPYPDTAPVMRELRRRGVPVQVLSNVAEPLAPLFERYGLSGAVDGYTLSYQQGREKPDPELFRIACRALGTEPRETLMVGDSYLADGAAALIGMPVLVLPMVPRGSVRGLGRAIDLLDAPGAG